MVAARTATMMQPSWCGRGSNSDGYTATKIAAKIPIEQHAAAAAVLKELAAEMHWLVSMNCNYSDLTDKEVHHG